MIQSMTLLGSASGRNAGDAALISSIMDTVDEACGKRLLYEIPTINPEFIWRTYENRVRPVSIMPWNLSAKLFGLTTYQSLMRTDLSLVFDATLFDRSLYNPLFNFLSSYYALLPLAKKKGKKMACYTVTVGPCRTQRGREMLKTVLEMMDFITVRDQDSIDEMREAGVENPNVIITNDVALNTRPSSPERISTVCREIGLPEDKEILALNVNPYFDSWAGLNRSPITKEIFVRTYTEAINKAIKDINANILFVSTQHLDESLTREIMAGVRTPNRKVYFSNKVYSHHDIKGVMAKASLLFAMRLHCLILTSSALTPIASLNYLPKVHTYMKSLGLTDYSLGFENFSTEDISRHLLKAWEDRSKIRKTLEGKIPQMKKEADRAGELVAALYRGESVEPIINKYKKLELQKAA
ncbi:MAG TPA: polysaccharide pyruvyl transferase family protein [Oligoflexia bacterium]|nr:polysaccharide pyruvyl transferase family protein [Oligoflexia bacterium]HMP48537.1 polysaccharide pyruvyl transferase family protein [Oligoflexia bacterium]